MSADAPWLEEQWGHVRYPEFIADKDRRTAVVVLKDAYGREYRGDCYWCGIPVYRVPVPPGAHFPKNLATRDHLLPKSMGGAGTKTVTACYDCNTKRGSRMDWTPHSMPATD